MVNILYTDWNILCDGLYLESIYHCERRNEKYERVEKAAKNIVIELYPKLERNGETHSLQDMEMI